MSLYRAYCLLRSPLTVVIPAPIRARDARHAAHKARRYLRREDWGIPEQLHVVNIANPSDCVGEPVVVKES